MAIRTTVHKLSGLLGVLHLHHTPRLFVSLLGDRRVPWHLKLCAVSGLIYIFSPLDVTPDLITGNRLVDDMIVAMLIMQAFLELAPQDVVHAHCAKMHIDPEKVYVNVPRTVLEALELYDLAKPWMARHAQLAKEPTAAPAAPGMPDTPGTPGTPGEPAPEDTGPPPYTRYSAFRGE